MQKVCCRLSENPPEEFLEGHICDIVFELGSTPLSRAPDTIFYDLDVIWRTLWGAFGIIVGTLFLDPFHGEGGVRKLRQKARPAHQLLKSLRAP